VGEVRNDCMTSWVVFITSPAGNGHLGLGGSLGGGSFGVKVDADRDKVSADENTQYSSNYSRQNRFHNIKHF